MIGLCIQNFLCVFNNCDPKYNSLEASAHIVNGMYFQAGEMGSYLKYL